MASCFASSSQRLSTIPRAEILEALGGPMPLEFARRTVLKCAGHAWRPGLGRRRWVHYKVSIEHVLARALEIILHFFYKISVEGLYRSKSSADSYTK